MRIEFPQTLAAVQAAEKSQWKIGDALLAEIPPSEPGKQDGSGKKFERCAQMLKEQGFDYSPRTLAELRDVAAAFPSPARTGGVSIQAHVKAATPENLKTAIVMCGKLRKPVTADNVAMVMQAWRKKDKEDRAEKKADATQRRKEAERRKTRAQNAAERKEAEKDEERAAKDEARYSSPPKTKDVETVPPDKGELEVRAMVTSFSADAKVMVKQLRNRKAELEDIIDQLDPQDISDLVDDHQPIVAAAQAIIDRLNRKMKFRVVGGAA